MMFVLVMWLNMWMCFEVKFYVLFEGVFVGRVMVMISDEVVSKVKSLLVLFIVYTNMVFCFDFIW